MRYLIDTCIISELRKPEPFPALMEWFRSCRPDNLFISSISIGELYYGISILANSKKKNSLLNWFNQVRAEFGDNILSVDHETVIIWADIRAKAKLYGRSLPVIDGLLAATTISNNLILVTRNTEDFQVDGLQILNPWQL